MYAFKVQRWAHLAVLIFSVISTIASWPSKIPVSDGENDNQVEEIMFRDVGKGTFAAICDTLSMITYQSAVFLAQWTIYWALESGEELVGPRYIWLIIEAIAFYCYLGAVVVYIVYFQLESAIKNEP